MSLTSLSFIGVYFPLLLIVYYNPFFKSDTFRKVILLLASLGLYTFCEPVYAILLLVIIVINYSLVRISDKTSSNSFRALAIVIDAGTLLFFKFINKILELAVNGEFSRIAFPIGLSYFMFKAISYVVDSKKQKGGKLIDVAIYISNFLTIVSGPLSTYEDELPMIQKRTNVTSQNVYRAVERISIGFAKKMIIADSLSVLVKQAVAASELSCVMAWAGAVAYILQLFFDFSGYTDIVIGVGTLFGFSLPENFNYPYMASSVSDLWRRWHISMTKWFTKYIYIPLGGSRVNSVARHIFNLFVVWIVTGVWHGSGMTYIIWAMIFFVLQVLEKYAKIDKFINRFHLGHVYTMLSVIIGWNIFRSESVQDAARYVKTMFMLNGNLFLSSNDLQSIVPFIIPLLLGIIFSVDVGVKLKALVSKYRLYAAYNTVLFVVYVVCIVITISKGYTSPLYAGF